jgi:uncharacterized glyoxalase superfamily protein PhnB
MAERTVYPTLQYTDPAKAVDWLVEAFGFTAHQVDKGPDGQFVHAELVLGTGMVMVSQARSARPRPADDDWRVYVAVDDVDAHHDRAVAAGAEIVMPLTDQPYGSREYGARDLGGNGWCFGNYRP